MAITFLNIPSSLRVNGAYAEIDGTRSGASGTEPQRVLLIATRQSTGTVAEAVPTDIIGERDADAYFGSQSQAAAMAYAFKALNKTARLTVITLNEAAGGTAGTGTFPITGTSTADGNLRVRIGDVRVSISVASNTAAAAVATSLAAAINGTERLMFSAAAATGTVTVTCRHKGEVSNDTTLEVELIPAGLSCSPTAITNGATNPTMSTAINVIPDLPFDTIVTGFTDSTSMAALEAEAARRWGALVKMPCQVMAGKRGSHGTLTTFGSARNSQYSTVVGSGLSPTPSYIWAAQVAARDAERNDSQPNKPRNGMTLPLCEAPKTTEQFDISERNLLLFDGISTVKFNAAGVSMIERLITTYQTNLSGLQDTTFLSLETQRNLAFLYKSVLQMASKYDDYLLAPNGTKFSPGVDAITPKDFAGDLIAWYEVQERAGLVTDSKGFAKDLVVEINELNHERLDVMMMPRLVNAKVVTAIKISFSL